MKPILVEKPSNKTVFIGETIEFRVGVQSGPEYLVSWIKHSGKTYEITTEIEVT